MPDLYVSKDYLQAFAGSRGDAALEQWSERRELVPEDFREAETDPSFC